MTKVRELTTGNSVRVSQARRHFHPSQAPEPIRSESIYQSGPGAQLNFKRRYELAPKFPTHGPGIELAPHGSESPDLTNEASVTRESLLRRIGTNRSSQALVTQYVTTQESVTEIR